MDDTPKAERLHALDNLRALMMWLGIVLHAGAIYMLVDSPLPWRDEHRSRVADLLVVAIHAFRMPVFFILAGFFVALLLRGRGPAGMARHRALRLGLPFAVFWLPLWLLTGVAALAFLHLIARGTVGLDPSVIPPHPLTPKGPNTMHMWFLWMLLWMSLATAAAARWLPGRWFVRAGGALGRWGMAPWGPFVMAVPLVVAGLSYHRGLVEPHGSFLPPLSEWLHNGVFYLFGLAVFHHQAELFDRMRRRWRAYAVVGFVAFMISGALYERHATPWVFAYAYSVANWFWSFAWIGAALSLANSRHPVMRYLADSSYWVYLVHMPLTVVFGLLLYGLDLHALVKLTLNVAATTAVCLATYHLFVRFTWVSVLLNGVRHPRRKRDPGDLAHAAP